MTTSPGWFYKACSVSRIYVKDWLHCVSIALTHRYILLCVTHESTLEARKLGIAEVEPFQFYSRNVPT